MVHLNINFAFLAAALLVSEVIAKIYNDPTPKQRRFDKRQLPANATDVKTITSPTGVKIRYKEPGKEGVCEWYIISEGRIFELTHCSQAKPLPVSTLTLGILTSQKTSTASFGSSSRGQTRRPTR
jgi:hypothetical protein